MRSSDWSSDVCSSDLDIGHISLDHYRAPPIQSHTRGRFREQIVAKRRSDAHPHQPAAFAHLARLRAAGAPSEALRSSLEAADQIAVRKGPSRIFGIDLRVIKDAERDREIGRAHV